MLILEGMHACLALQHPPHGLQGSYREPGALLQGGSLGDKLHSLEIDPLRRGYNEQLAVDWCLDICSALDYLHGLPVRSRSCCPLRPCP